MRLSCSLDILTPIRSGKWPKYSRKVKTFKPCVNFCRLQRKLPSGPPQAPTTLLATDTALEHLARIVAFPDSDDSGVESPENTIAWRVGNDPQTRNPSVDSKERGISLSEQVSKMRLLETPVKNYPFKPNEWSSPASTDFSVPSPMDPDHQAASDAFNRDTAQLTGDEQTVNTCLVDLIIAVAGMLKSRGRVRLDREPFRVLKKEVTGKHALLYEARVDGIVMEKNLQNIQGFMEVKRDLRLQKKDVRIQEGTQMAAFVYSKGSSIEATRYAIFFHPTAFARHRSA